MPTLWTRIERYVFPFFLVGIATIYLAARFRAGSAFLAFFEDDFFYYLTVARNIASGHGSTFDGIHLTNGYHPLWLLTNVALFLCFPGRSFYYALTVVMAASVLVTYFSVAKCFSLYMTPRKAACCACLVAAQFALIMSGGMEIILTVPLLTCLAAYRLRRFKWAPAHGAIYGLLASAVILARLDAVLFIAALGVLEVALGSGIPLTQRLKTAAGFAVGLLPVLIYVLVNLVVFHTATPISGAAKQLRTSHSPDLTAIKITTLGGWPPVVMLSRPVLVGIVCAVLLLALRGRGRLSLQHRALVWALILFPLLQLGTLSVLSDWPIWEWYFYPFVCAAAGIILVLGTRQEAWLAPIARFAAPACALVAAALLCKIAVHDLRAAKMPKYPMYDFYHAANDLAAFAAIHPGTYAMGDRAGLVGYEIHRPLIQTEGLMMDKAFLENIRAQRNLLDVLKAYGVRYYIASDLKPGSLLDRNGCFALREPVQAGPSSPTMRATLCKTPALAFRYNGIQTYIFDLQ